MNKKKFEAELRGVEDAYRDATGKEIAKYFRPPQGKFSESRTKLDQLMITYGLSGEDVIKQIYREVIGLDVPDSIKVHLVDRVGEYSFRLSEGADERIQLEALLAQLVLAGQKKV